MDTAELNKNRKTGKRGMREEERERERENEENVGSILCSSNDNS